MAMGMQIWWQDLTGMQGPISGQSIAIQEIVDTDTIKVFVGITTFQDLPYGEVTDWRITRSGYGFRRGDKFTPVGLVTDARLTSPQNEFELTKCIVQEIRSVEGIFETRTLIGAEI